MPEVQKVSDRQLAVLREATACIGRARDAFARSRTNDDPIERGCAIVERVAADLALLADRDETDQVRRTILGWRDHLSSHVFAARALLDIEVDSSLPAHLLERGLAEVAAV